MQTNASVAKQLSKIAKLMTLKGENPFKVKAFEKARDSILQSATDLALLHEKKQLNSLPNVGKSIEKEVITILETGKSELLEELEAEFPKDIVQLVYTAVTPKTLQKILVAFSPNSAEEILQLIQSGKLEKIKGFGKKSVSKLEEKIRLYLENRSKWLFHYAWEFSQKISERFSKEGLGFHLAGDVLLAKPVVNELQFVVIKNKKEIVSLLENSEQEIIFLENTEGKILAETSEGKRLAFFLVSPEEFYKKVLELSLEVPEYKQKLSAYASLQSLEEFWKQENFKQIPFPEHYDNPQALALAREGNLPRLITYEDLKGVVHVHTQYSDGKNTLREMVKTAEELGYEYIVISDHSQAASYAGGLTPDALKKQWQEINTLNRSENIHIFKSIEADILADGSIDYNEEIQRQFDFIIASVHSGLSMNKEKATERLSKALENPNVSIVGHISGRLLLKRKGYDLDYEKIMALCKARKIVIEFNANPYRMDIDYALLPKLFQAGVKTVITPDAHSVGDYSFVQTGVKVLRRVLTTPENVINTYSKEDFRNYFG